MGVLDNINQVIEDSANVSGGGIAAADISSLNTYGQQAATTAGQNTVPAIKDWWANLISSVENAGIWAVIIIVVVLMLLVGTKTYVAKKM